MVPVEAPWKDAILTPAVGQDGKRFPGLVNESTIDCARDARRFERIPKSLEAV
jgi:hypothetical protein